MMTSLVDIEDVSGRPVSSLTPLDKRQHCDAWTGRADSGSIVCDTFGQKDGMRPVSKKPAKVVDAQGARNLVL